MTTFVFIFALLAALTIYAIKTTRAIDQVEEAELEAVEDHHKMDLCRHAVTDGVCRFECGRCPWHVEEDTSSAADAAPSPQGEGMTGEEKNNDR